MAIDAKNYDRIQRAIEFLYSNFKSQPSLEEVAKHVGLSEFHFQKLFTDWAGVSPKQFLKFLTIKYAKDILKKSQKSLLDASLDSGLSGSGRLHDLFVTIESMTPGEYKKLGSGLEIRYSFNTSKFGNYIIASTDKGICNLFFFDNSKEEALELLKRSWKNAKFIHLEDSNHKTVQKFFENDFELPEKIKLHLKGTPFQLKIWEALLRIPEGSLLTYSDLAQSAGSPKAQRAAGTAISMNPISYIIPCHRVITSIGKLGNYRWGSGRKKTMIGAEASARDKASARN